MKIALFTNTFTPHVGGVANSVSALAGWLRERGHSCLVLAPEFPGQPKDETDVIRIPAIENFNGTGFSFRLPSFGKIHLSMESFRPDIIHSHHPFLLGDAAIREAGYRDLPIVFTHHTRYEDYVHYLFEDSETLETLARELATGYANLCDRVVVPSESIKDLVTSRGVKVPVSVVPTGINLENFAGGDGTAFRSAHGIPAGVPVLGHVGRIEREKNVVFLANAVGLALQRDPACWFLLAGEGKCKESVTRILADAGVVERTVMLGRLSRPELAGAYKAMDVFLFCSKSETQGMVLAEAMAAGRPVIALDAPGAREIVCHEKNGYLLPQDASVETFAGAIAMWRQQPDRIRRDWEVEIPRTAEAFSLDACMRKLERIYEELLLGQTMETNVSPWEQLMGRFEAEWELAAEKARAASAALTNLASGD